MVFAEQVAAPFCMQYRSPYCRASATYTCGICK